MLKTLLSLVIIASFTKLTFCVDYYSVVGSKTIKANSKYDVTVSLLDAAKSATIKLSIRNDKNYKLTNSILVEPRTSKVVQFSIGALDPGTYKLVAEGPAGLVNEKFINFPSKNQSIFIQTDKAMYKPGDKVRFRVLVLDSDLNPAIVKKMDVFITDSGNNKIKQWLKAATTLGVFNEELQLAQNPPLGLWKVNVEVNNEKRSKEFEIAEYVLPKFDVSVSAPKDATYSDSLVRITFSAKYTYGENVKGTAVVSVIPTGSSKVAERNVVDINGSGFAEFQMSEFQNNVQNFENTFAVNVAVTEAVTGNLIEDTAALSIRKLKFAIKDLDSDPKYTPETEFTLMLQVAYHDDSPYINTGAPIKVYYGTPELDNTDLTLLNSGYMDANGLAKIDITLPDSPGKGFNIFVQFLEYFENVNYYTKQNPTIFTDQYALSAILLTKNAKVNDVISISITSFQPLSYINYLLSSRGKLISSARKNIPNEDIFTITFPATFEMAPSVKFVAYYALSTGEIVSTNVDVPVTGLNNFVKVRTSTAEKQPGEKVDIIVSTKASSNVCLLGVDQSVVLLKSGNDIVLTDAYAELDGYNRYAKVGSTWKNFDAANLFIMTNAVEPPQFIKAGDGLMALSMRGNTEAVAFDAGPVPSAILEGPQPRVRKHFPETWLWNCNAVSSGSLTVTQKVPDTITSWHITAFSTNAKFGLGITENRTAFKVFKKFFISLNLPYSIKRGETIALSIVVFNYMAPNVTATVTLDNSLKEFEFADPFTQIYKDKGCPQAIELTRSKNVNILADNGAEVIFFITPLVTGPIRIKVNAVSKIAGDAIEVMLPVEPEGVTQYKSKAVLVDLRQTKSFTTDFTVDVPEDAVKDSTRVSFSLIGEFMGATMTGILNNNNIIQYPSGCGEQNMIRLAPDVVILLYLTKVGRLTVEFKTQLIQYCEIGYQGQLSYLRSDGSFSAWGNGDVSGSTWLTAFVIRIFIQASDFICIDNAIISRGLEWLKRLQNADGSFPELGRVIHYDMQGISQQGVALTAYVVTAFVQTGTYAMKYAAVVTKALNYIKTKMDTFEDVYALSIACYAAHLANHESKGALLKRLDKFVKNEGEYRYWERVKMPADPWYPASSVNVEVTSYALLSYIKGGRILDAAPIARWLLSKQNKNGGYASTQDTVMAITALAAYSGDIFGIGTGGVMSCSLTYGSPSAVSKLKIDNNNLQVLQTVELPRATKSAKLTCTGNGTALAHFSYQYNLNKCESVPSFELKVNVDPKSNDFLLMLHICTSYIATGFGNQTNMAIIEAELPTGYIADLETIKETIGNRVEIRNIETKNGNTVVVIYLDNVSASQICLKLIAYRICKIADQKPVAVQVYDYYNNFRRKTAFYQVKPLNLCGICSQNDCKQTCNKPVKDVTCPKKV